MKISPLRPCDFCKQGIGKDVYKSSALEGQYCSQDCYMSAMVNIIGGLRGKYKLVTIPREGVELVA